MIAFRNVHDLHHFLDRHGLVRIYHECRVFFRLQLAYQGILDAVSVGSLTEERIDESVRRILNVKKQAGLIG